MELYLADIREFADGEGMDLLPEARRARAARYRRSDDRARSVVAGLLVRHAFGAGAGAALLAGERGKPYLPAEALPPGAPRHFNLSHSGRYVALLAGALECGVDVERANDTRDLDSMARHFFTPEEYDWLLGPGAPPGRAAGQRVSLEGFYLLWTGKESVMKATGRGMAMTPGSFSVLPVRPGPRRIDGRDWDLCWHHGLPGYALCSCRDPAETGPPPPLTPLTKAALLS
jgi:4'-phosphopantetheinyl transferase